MTVNIIQNLGNTMEAQIEKIQERSRRTKEKTNRDEQQNN